MLEKYYICPGIDEIIINTNTTFYTNEKLFELFCFKKIWLNVFQNVALYLLKYFILHFTIISRNDTLLYCRANQISFSCRILRNAFLAPD